METNRWKFRRMVPLLVEPCGQPVITKDGRHGRIERLTDVGPRVAYEVRLNDGRTTTVFATDLDLVV